jgi:hypothetical protein
VCVTECVCVNGDLSAIAIDIDKEDDTYFNCLSLSIPAVQAMRSGELNKECNRRMDILSVINEFHQACFFDFVR